VSFAGTFGATFGAGIIPTLIGVAGSFALGIVLVGILAFTGAVLSRFLIYPDQGREVR
jgi:hypothetical protein